MGKKNAQYWTDRGERRKQEMEVLTAQQQKGLAASLQDARRQVEGEIARFYRRYAQNNSMSYEEAQRALSLNEMKSYRGRLEDFQALVQQHMGKFSQEVENLSLKARVTRFQALKAEIDAALEQTYSRMEQTIAEGAKAVYEDQYHRALFDIDQYTGFRHQYAGIDQNALEETTRYPFNGLDYSTRIWRQQEDLTYQLQKTLNTMFTTGEPPDRYAKEFAEAFQVKEREAYRLLYTENAYLSEQAKIQSYRDTGATAYEILATLDSKTSPICQEQDGKRYAVAEAMPGKSLPPFHPWCRSTTVPVVEGLEAGFRTARDPETGKTYEVPGDMTYQQWKNTRLSAMIDKGDNEQFSQFLDRQGEMPTEYRQVLEARFASASPEAQQAFLRFVPDGSVSNSSVRDAYYNPKTKHIYMNFAEDFINDVGAGFTYFHEHGHLIDCTATPPLSLQNYMFKGSLRSDFLSYVHKYREAHGVNLARAYEEISAELQGDQNAAVSDLFGAFSQNACVGEYAHPIEYWEQSPNLVANEAFASMFEAEFDQEKRNVMEKYFPNGSQVFKKILKGLIDDGKEEE